MQRSSMQLLSQGLRQCGHLVSVDGMAGAFGVLRFNERIIGMSDSCLSAREHLSGGTSFASLRNNHFAERVKIEVKLPLSPTGSFYIDSTAGVLPQFAERRSTHGNASISGSSSQAAAVKSSLSVGNLGQHESHFRDHMVAKSLMMQRMQVAGLQTSAAPSLGQRALEDDASHNHDDHDIMDEGDRASTQLQHLKENNLETDEGNTAVTQPGELEGAVESTKRHFNPMPLTPPLHREECALFDEGGGKQAPVHVPSSVAGPIWWQLPEMEALRLPPRFMEQAKEFFDRLGIPNVSMHLILATLVHESYYNSALTTKRFGTDAVQGTLAFRSVRAKLEFLGDAVLNSVLTTYLVESSGNGPIGDISKTVHHLRSNQSMSAVGLGTLQLANLILCDPDLNSEKPVKRGALRAAWHGPAKANLVSDTLETIIGGIFVEQGIGVASILILDKILPLLQHHAGLVTGDPVTKLQELTMARANCFPVYRILPRPGSRGRAFIAEVYLNKKLLGTGQGESKGRAKNEAAQQGLKNLENSRP